jgi:protein-S-isoprenylcysteine O-methyltransferase Ste14
MTAASPPVSTNRGDGGSRSWSDWAGFATFLAVAFVLGTGIGTVGMLLVVPIVFELAVAVTFVIRGRARRTAAGWAPRVMAYGSTFLLMVFMRVSIAMHPAWVAATTNPAMRTAGAILWVFGVALGFWPLWHLRRAFSVEPQARVLITSGPYQVARHPIYASYLVNYTGVCLLRLTVPMVLVTLCWLALTCIRLRYEERVLGAAFPEYTAYRQRVPAFGVRTVSWHRWTTTARG